LSVDFACPFGVTAENAAARTSMPSLVHRARNLGGAIVQAARAAGKPAPLRVSPEELATRQARCTAPCPWFRLEKGACGRCGCNYKLKVLLAAWHCPIGEW
jgi:hypothetical protein